MSRTTNRGKALEKAFELFAKKLGTQKIEVTYREFLPIYREKLDLAAFYGTRHEEGNKPSEALILDEKGSSYSEKEVLHTFEVEKLEHLLAHTAVNAAVLPPLAVPTTDKGFISPKVNNLELKEDCTFEEIIRVGVPKKGELKADVYFLSDNTGSMGGAINSVKSASQNIMAQIATLGDIHFGAGNYLDHGDPYAFKNNQSITSDQTDVSTAINTWIANGGDQWPEAQLYALHQIATDPAIKWRNSAKKIVVWYGDAPGNNPSGGIDLATAVAALQKANITVLAIGIGANSLDSASPATPEGPAVAAGQATAITSHTNGSFQTGINATNTAAAIINIVNAELSVIDEVTLEPTGNIAPFLALSEPGKYGPITLENNKQKVLDFKVKFRGAVKCLDKKQVFTGAIEAKADGEVFASKKVTIVVPACCECDDPCKKAAQEAEKQLERLAGKKLYTVSSNLSEGKPDACKVLELPRIVPHFSLKAGDYKEDQLSNRETEVMMLQVCNPFKNVLMRDILITKLELVSEKGVVIPYSAIGKGKVEIAPSTAIYIHQIKPCSCVYREVSLTTHDVPSGKYTLRYEYCVGKIELKQCTSGIDDFDILISKERALPKDINISVGTLVKTPRGIKFGRK